MNPKLRDQIIAEWRGYTEPRPDRSVPLSATLVALMKKLGLAERLCQEEIMKEWSALVGDFLAAHSVPDRIRDRVLIVRVIQPTLLYELDRHWKPQILAKLKEKYGVKVIKDIRFRAG
ncbi:MAG TPA: DUF721 domain-containing protein [Chthoniobacterales bacterium]